MKKARCERTQGNRGSIVTANVLTRAANGALTLSRCGIYSQGDTRMRTNVNPFALCGVL